MGSSLALSNTQGSPETTYTYEPFGKTTITGTSANPFQFTGRENDGAGVYYFRARYYGSRQQRFLAQDLLDFLSNGFDPTLYAYVNNDPVNFFDPFGLAKDKHRLPGQQGGKGALSGDDPIVRQARQISQDTQDGRQGAKYIKKILNKGVDPNGKPLSPARKDLLRAAMKLLGQAAKRGIQIGGSAVGIILSVIEPAEANAPTSGKDLQNSKTQDDE